MECTFYHSSKKPELKFVISNPKNFFPYESLRIEIGFYGIRFFFERINHKVSLKYSIQGRCVEIVLNGHKFIVTNHNLKQICELIDSRLPLAISGIVDLFNIREGEELLLSYRRGTKDVLRRFCPGLPDDVCSVIWDLAISDEVLSSKLICGFARLLDDAVEDREQHWLKNMSRAVSKILNKLKSSELSYLLEKSFMKTVNFEPLGHFVKGMYISD